jgi:transposase
MHHIINYLRALYRRLSSRRGRKRVAIGTARSILVIAYHMLKNGTEYQDLGADHFDNRHRERIQRQLVKRLEALGVQVSIEAPAV